MPPGDPMMRLEGAYRPIWTGDEPGRSMGPFLMFRADQTCDIHDFTLSELYASKL